jgi:hypothetical protein
VTNHLVLQNQDQPMRFPMDQVELICDHASTMGDLLHKDFQEILFPSGVHTKRIYKYTNLIWSNESLYSEMIMNSFEIKRHVFNTTSGLELSRRCWLLLKKTCCFIIFCQSWWRWCNTQCRRSLINLITKIKIPWLKTKLCMIYLGNICLYFMYWLWIFRPLFIHCIDIIWWRCIEKWLRAYTTSRMSCLY